MKSKNDIPKFDLTEQIMVEQRKTASVKRKAPNKKNNSNSNSNSNRNRDSIPTPDPIPAAIPIPMPNPCEKIIAEIVARDIQKIRSR